MTALAGNAAQDVVLRFLASIGRPAEAEAYLQRFQRDTPARFAVVHVSDAVIRDAFDALIVNLRFLVELGLRPVLAFGALGPRGARRAAERVRDALAGTIAATVTTADAAGALATAGGLALVPLVAGADDAAGDDARFDRLAALASALGTGKLVFLSRRSGLQPAGGRVESIIDLAEIPAVAPRLSPSQRQLLRQTARVIEQVGHPLTVAITSPLDLLRELFTVKGAGTLVRRGSVISRATRWDDLDGDRLVALIEDAFGRRLAPGFRERPFHTAFVAGDYRGAALVVDTPLGPYLSKFAVTTMARGEGVGRDLWRALIAAYPKLFWRSRADNPITSWYREQCDGLQRLTAAGSPWVVLWRGLPPTELAAAIAHCLATPPDFA
ncbi:MAG: hypothetical protein R2939_21585 [Kofleriaceae bacterium]